MDDQLPEGNIMSRDVTFYGLSHDLFECDDGEDNNEIYHPHKGPAVFVIEAFGNIGVQVVGICSTGAMEGAVWSIGLAPLDEDVPLPDWSMKWSADGCTAKLTITIPDDAKVRRAKYYDLTDDNV